MKIQIFKQLNGLLREVINSAALAKCCIMFKLPPNNKRVK